MKKILFVLVMFIIGTNNVFALDTKVDSISVSEKSDAVTINNLQVNDMAINSNLTFSDLNQYVVFSIKLDESNRSNNDIEKRSDNKNNQYLKTSYTYDEDTIYMRIKYEEEPEEALNLNDININISYRGDSNGIINPATINNYYFIIILLCAIVITTILIIKYKNKSFGVLLILLILLVPIMIFAKNSIVVTVVLKSSNIRILGIKENYTNSFDYIKKQSNMITPGDEVIINSEHFYVIGSDSNKTTLLSKYNLLVGNVFDWDNYKFNFVKTFNENDKGYMLQNRTTNSDINLNTMKGRFTGVVPFAGINYWDYKQCPPGDDGEIHCEDRDLQLKEEYAINGASYDGNPYPYVYDSTKSSIAPSYYCKSTEDSEGGCYSQNNGYTIAYYVEDYLSRLKTNMNLESSSTARLLSFEEMIPLKNVVLGYDVNVNKCVVAGTQLAMDSFGLDNETAAEAAKTICNGDVFEGISLRGMINHGDITSEYYDSLGISNVQTFDTEVKNYEFWLGSVKDDTFVWSSSSVDEEYGYSYDRAKVPGVRPVIVVNTSELLSQS